MKVRKFQLGSPVLKIKPTGTWLDEFTNPLQNNSSFKLQQNGASFAEKKRINVTEPPSSNVYRIPQSAIESAQINSRIPEIFNNKQQQKNNQTSDQGVTIVNDSNQGSLPDNEVKQLSTAQKVGSSITSAALNAGANYVGNKLFGTNSDMGRIMGSIFSSGITSGASAIGNNLLKGSVWSDNILKDTGASLAGTAVGIGANYLGQGVNSLGGDTYTSRFAGQATSTGLGMVGGQAASNLVKYGTLAGKASDGSKVALVGKTGQINPYVLAGTMIGEGLAAGNGTPREYEGKYGKTTSTLNTAYDIASGVLGSINPYVGMFMALNKGLHGIHGGTSGMTKNDVFLGNYFAPAGAHNIAALKGHTTSKLNNYNQFTHNKMYDFMGNAYGNLGDKIQQSYEEQDKKYGGGTLLGFFDSTDAYEEAQKNIDLMNETIPELLRMYDQNRRQNIRAFDMTSINNQRYAQNINGGFKSLAIGKQGMKILNGAVNHNMGMRLLSAAALIDDKQAILCNVPD